VLMDMENSDGPVNKIINFIIEHEKSYDKKSKLIRTTTDCDVLKTESLELTSQGYNPDKLFSGRYDHMLGIAEKRYDLFC